MSPKTGEDNDLVVKSFFADFRFAPYISILKTKVLRRGTVPNGLWRKPLNPSAQKVKTTGIESIMRKLVLATVTIVGVGYVLANIGGAVMLGYFLSTRSIITAEILPNVGALFFLIAIIVVMVVAVFLILGGLQYFRTGNPPQEEMFFGTLLASFYLLCLGIGSSLLSLLQMSLNTMLLIVAPVIVMVGTAIYMIPSSRPRLIGSVLGVAGGVLLAYVFLDPPTLKLALGIMHETWNEVPFSGPFMSMSLLEGMAFIVGSIAAFVHSIFAERKEDLLTHAILIVAALVYGVGLFAGSLVLSFSLLDLLYKVRWPISPFYNMPDWIFGAGVFWSASLIILVIGGIVLILCACLGFAFTIQESSQTWLLRIQKKQSH